MIVENPNHAIAAFVASLPKGSKGQIMKAEMDPMRSDFADDWKLFLFLLVIFVLGLVIGFLIAEYKNSKTIRTTVVVSENAGITPMPPPAPPSTINRRRGGQNISFRNFKHMIAAMTGNRIHLSSACAGPTNKRTFKARRRCFVPKLSENCLDCGFTFDRCTCD